MNERTGLPEAQSPSGELAETTHAVFKTGRCWRQTIIPAMPENKSHGQLTARLTVSRHIQNLSGGRWLHKLEDLFASSGRSDAGNPMLARAAVMSATCISCSAWDGHVCEPEQRRTAALGCSRQRCYTAALLIKSSVSSV